ncbi:hypothetical protein FUAX_45560 (plasmid) [Fulvitalea axinellae]|uniref:Transposase n=1 Tax=Fulvitalea axinellae TaxID=1182444 RepID=A0AAU9DCB9_9BACT|nr:hypothetical protein FUAX_45560 [Fulvitalea axinellae]
MVVNLLLRLEYDTIKMSIRKFTTKSRKALYYSVRLTKNPPIYP